MGQAAFYGSLAIGDFGWIEPLWADLQTCVLYRERKMTDERTGLAKWWDGMESGADNNAALVRRYHNSVAAADVNGFLVLDYRAMAQIATRLGKKADAAAFTDRAARLARAVNEHLWDPEAQSYFNLDTVERQLIRRVTYSNQIPLWARIASPEQARAMIERYVLAPGKLWGNHGIRSLAADDPQYNNENILKPYSNWQGPIWPHANWMFVHALVHYGYADAAVQAAERVARVCLADLTENRMMHENYHADTGRPLAAPDFVSWNVLVANIVEEARARLFKPDPAQTLWT
jgi:alpha,alpha-trehalase